MNREKVLKMKPSAYRSMMMGKLGLTKSSPQKKKDLLRWGSPTKGEKWINLTAKITDKKIQPCGMKGKKQKQLGLPSVCRPSVKVSNITPKLAQDFTTKQIKKAIQIKKKGKTINWKKL
jgi:hypothetical protein